MGGNTTASILYIWEHSDASGIQCYRSYYDCSSDVIGTSTWIGKVGLMSLSDYAYATGGGSIHNLNTCLSTHTAYTRLYSTKNWANTYTDCKNNDWLLSTMPQWTIVPYAYDSSSFSVITLDYSGVLGGMSANETIETRPVVYLKRDVEFSKEDGSESNPYVLSLS